MSDAYAGAHCVNAFGKFGVPVDLVTSEPSGHREQVRIQGGAARRATNARRESTGAHTTSPSQRFGVRISHVNDEPSGAIV